MKKNRMFALLILIAVSAGCASHNMDRVSADAYVTRPAAGKALIYFVRDTSFGGGVQAEVYDDVQYIGTSSAHTHIAYQADPGKHMFMVLGESADFLQADLLEGKTYYAYVMPRMGVWKARFSFRPQNGQVDRESVDRSITQTKQVIANAKGIAQGEKSKASAKKMKSKYLPEWEGKQEGAKQILNADSGR